MCNAAFSYRSIVKYKTHYVYPSQLKLGKCFVYFAKPYKCQGDIAVLKNNVNYITLKIRFGFCAAQTHIIKDGCVIAVLCTIFYQIVMTKTGYLTITRMH